jgi:hypothetical protein
VPLSLRPHSTGRSDSADAVEAHKGSAATDFHSFLSSALDGDDWSASRPGRFTPQGAPVYPLVRRLEGLQTGRSRVRSRMVSLEFFIDIILSVFSASNGNEYQEYFLGGKGGRCVGLTTLPPSSADCLEIWEPPPPGTLKACPGL